ncbi:MAG: FISUMP domain-containing protein, partial [Flavobacteriales bacterium]
QDGNVALFIGAGQATSPFAPLIQNVGWDENNAGIFLQTFVDMGEGETDIGVTQLMSIPFALAASRSGQMMNGKTVVGLLPDDQLVYTDSSTFIIPGLSDANLYYERGEGATDVDGNYYKSAIIQTQEGPIEFTIANLRSTKLNDGTSIPSDSLIWFEQQESSFATGDTLDGFQWIRSTGDTVDGLLKEGLIIFGSDTVDGIMPGDTVDGYIRFGYPSDTVDGYIRFGYPVDSAIQRMVYTRPLLLGENSNCLTVEDSTLGYLYNWYAVATGQLCPVGWHAPTYHEFNLLLDALDSNAQTLYLQPYINQGDLSEENTYYLPTKRSEASAPWLSTSNFSLGALGFVSLINGQINYAGLNMQTDIGYRYSLMETCGECSYNLSSGAFWTVDQALFGFSSDCINQSVLPLGLAFYLTEFAQLDYKPRDSGLSVRCVRDREE